MSEEKSAGPLKKYCPKCDHIVHCRTKVCTNCQHKFELAGKVIIDERKSDEPVKILTIGKERSKAQRVLRAPAAYDGYEIKERIHAPAGRGPYKISKEKGVPTEEQVRIWADATRMYFLHKNQTFMTNNALAVFARLLYDTFSEEYKQIEPYIRNLPDIEIVTLEDEGGADEEEENTD